jgi:hypothetical protein
MPVFAEMIILTTDGKSDIQNNHLTKRDRKVTKFNHIAFEEREKKWA